MGKLEKVFVSKKTFGKYTSTLEWYVKDGIWIDNCYKSTITDRAGNVLEIVDKVRPVPEKIKPDKIVSPPIEGEPPIEGTGKLWYLDPMYLRDRYIFEHPLTKPVVAWVIKVGDGIFIFDSKSGKQIGRNLVALSSTTFFYGPWPEANKKYAKAAFSQLGFSNIDKTTTDLHTSRETLLGLLRNDDVKYIYLDAHGDPNGCAGVRFCDIMRAMENRTPIWFAIMNCCNIMKYTGYGSISYALRKGSMKGTVTIGLSAAAVICWEWQDKLFAHALAGNTWWDSFNYANAAEPWQVDSIAFCGDKSMKVKGSSEIERPTGINKFLFSEVVENHLPEYAVGYVCGGVCGYGDPTDMWFYTPPEGYSVTACEDIGSSHGCIPEVEVARIRCDKTGYVPPGPGGGTPTAVTFQSVPSRATIDVNKV